MRMVFYRKEYEEDQPTDDPNFSSSSNPKLKIRTQQFIQINTRLNTFIKEPHPTIHPEQHAA